MSWFLPCTFFTSGFKGSIPFIVEKKETLCANELHEEYKLCAFDLVSESQDHSSSKSVRNAS